MGDIEISAQEANIYDVFLASRGRWFTSKEIAEAAGVANRTARMHCRRFTELGIVDRAAVFPGHRYRLSSAGEWNADYLRRLADACAVFGLSKQAG
jgi:DNA-binding CsgD family transcriptional regulator